MFPNILKIVLTIMYCCRETLLGQLTVYIKGIKDDFVSRTQGSFSGAKDGSGPPKGKNMPEIVNNVVWVRQLEAKVWSELSPLDKISSLLYL